MGEYAVIGRDKTVNKHAWDDSIIAALPRWDHMQDETACRMTLKNPVTITCHNDHASVGCQCFAGLPAQSHCDNRQTTCMPGHKPRQKSIKICKKNYTIHATQLPEVIKWRTQVSRQVVFVRRFEFVFAGGTTNNNVIITRNTRTESINLRVGLLNTLASLVKGLNQNAVRMGMYKSQGKMRVQNTVDSCNCVLLLNIFFIILPKRLATHLNIMLQSVAISRVF